MSKSFIEKVNELQTKLIAPKGQFNAFGKYKYRNCEDILEAVKPLLKETGLVLLISDSIEIVGDRIYIKATATLTDGNSNIYNSAFAREPLTRKGMDDAQVTGASSSYARKYALNGLLCIDDNKDADNEPPIKKDYKKIAQLVDAIKDASKLVTKDFDLQQKTVFMRNVLEVTKFDDLSSKDEASLERILEKCTAK